MSDLTHKKVERRVEDGQMLSQQEGGRAIPALLGALKQDPSVDVREEVVNILYRLPDPRIGDGLIQALRADESPVLRARIARLLSEITHPGSWAALTLAAHRDTSVPVRKEAVWSLGQLNDARSLGTLKRVLKDEKDPGIRREAVLALGGKNLQAGVEAVLVDVMTRDTNPWVRREAAAAVAKRGGAGALSALIQALESEKDTTVLQQLILGVGTFQEASVAPELVRLYRSGQYPGLHQSMLEILAARKDPLLADFFYEAMRAEKNPLSRKLAVSALAHMDDPRVVGVLCRILDTEQEPWLRESTLMSLARMTGNVGAMSAALTLAMKEKKGVAILEDEGDSAPRQGPPRKLLNRSSRAGTTPEERERAPIQVDGKNTQSTLVFIRMGLVNEMKKSKDVRFVPVLAEAVFQEPEPIIREAMVAALGRIGVAEGLEPLNRVMHTESEGTVREQAAVAIGRILDPQSIPLLKGLLTDRQPEVQMAARQALESRGILSTDLFESKDKK